MRPIKKSEFILVSQGCDIRLTSGRNDYKETIKLYSQKLKAKKATLTYIFNHPSKLLAKTPIWLIN